MGSTQRWPRACSLLPRDNSSSRSLWHNRLARSAVNRKVGGSSPPRDYLLSGMFGVFNFWERNMTWICCSTPLCTRTATLSYWDDALTNWTTQPWPDFLNLRKQKPNYCSSPFSVHPLASTLGERPPPLLLSCLLRLRCYRTTSVKILRFVTKNRSQGIWKLLFVRVFLNIFHILFKLNCLSLWIYK